MKEVKGNVNGVLQDSNGNKSSKRIAGYSLIGIGAAMGIVLFIYAIFKVIADAETASNVYKTFIYSGAGLLGIGVVEFFKKK